MWLVWIEAYLVAMSGSAWYANFSHQAGKGLSRAADQQVAAAVLWLVATAVFVPVIFLAAMRWLHSGGDADDELRRLLKEQRRGVGLLPEPRAGGPPDGAG
jgi:cytochrome c oxidase assembly factor CtaG